MPLSELENRAKELDVYDVRPFLASRLFQMNSYSFDAQKKTISKTFGTAAGEL